MQDDYILKIFLKFIILTQTLTGLVNRIGMPLSLRKVILFCWVVWSRIQMYNKPFPSSLVPLFQNESQCETFHLKLSSAHSFIFMQIKVTFHKNSFALRLIWKQRHKEAWKWPTKVRMCYVALNLFAVIVLLELYLLLLLSVVIQMDKFLGCTVFCCCHFCLHSVLKMSLK